MSGVLEVSLGTRGGWLTPHAFGVVLHQVDKSLEELDRLADPARKRRVTWRVVSTNWDNSGPTVGLRPDVAHDQRSTEEMLRPSLALVRGIRHLHSEPEIPAHFSEGVLGRISKVANQVSQPSSGLESVELRTIGVDEPMTSIDSIVSANVARAVESASMAYGSVTGVLDLISTRGAHDRVGLLADFGPPINCRVDQLDRRHYLDALDERVTVSGLIRRNGRGQIIRIDADELELSPEFVRVWASDLRGAISPSTLTVEQFMKEQRGR